MLENFRKTSLNWDRASDTIYTNLKANSSDQRGRSLEVRITDNGNTVDISNTNLSLAWESQSKKNHGLDAFSKSNGFFVLHYTTGMLSNVGKLRAQLVLNDSNGRVVSSAFEIEIERGFDEGAVESSDSFTALQDLYAKIATIDENGNVALLQEDSVGNKELKNESVSLDKVDNQLIEYLTGDFDKQSLPTYLDKNSLLKVDGDGTLWQHTDNILIANDGIVSNTDGSGSVLTVKVDGAKVTVNGTNTGNKIVVLSGDSLRIGSTYPANEDLPYSGAHKLLISPKSTNNPNVIFGVRTKSNTNVVTINSVSSNVASVFFDDNASCIFLLLISGTTYSNAEYNIGVVSDDVYSSSKDYFTGYYKRIENVQAGDNLFLNTQSEKTKIELIGTTGTLYSPPDNESVVVPEIENAITYHVERASESVSGIAGSHFKLFIYKNIGNGYFIRYKLTHAKHTGKNMDVWTIHTAQLCRKNDDVYITVSEVVNIGEWEAALKIKDAVDFMGGIAHGDEINTESTLFVDGISTRFGDETSTIDYSSFECEEIKLLVKSKFYHPDNGTYVADHVKHYTFGEDGITISQKVIWQSTLTLSQSYLSMLPIKRTIGDSDGSGQVTDRVYDNKDYEIVDCSVKGFTGVVTQRGRSGVSRYDIYGTTSGISASLEVTKSEPNLQGAGSFAQETSDQYNKIYFDFCGPDYTTTVGETWEFESIFNINYTE